MEAGSHATMQASAAPPQPLGHTPLRQCRVRGIASASLPLSPLADSGHVRLLSLREGGARGAFRGRGLIHSSPSSSSSKLLPPSNAPSSVSCGLNPPSTDPPRNLPRPRERGGRRNWEIAVTFNNRDADFGSCLQVVSFTVFPLIHLTSLPSLRISIPFVARSGEIEIRRLPCAICTCPLRQTEQAKES